MTVVWIPNALTLTRLAVVVPMLWCLSHGSFGPALGLFALAGITDAVDGVLARRLNARSALGAVLDPLADKVLLSGTFVVLAGQGVLPIWLAGLVVARDLAILTGAVVMRLRWGTFDPMPSPLSKVNTGAQIALAAVAMVQVWLASGLGDFVILSLIVGILTVVVVVTTMGSGLGYAWTTWHRVSREREEVRTRPDGDRA